MTQTHDKPGEQCAQVSVEEQCAACLAHYDHVTTVAHEWNNQVPQAIRAWYAAKALPSHARPNTFYCAAGGCESQCTNCADEAPPSTALPATGETPRTDAAVEANDVHSYVRPEFARQLERELAEAEGRYQSAVHGRAEFRSALKTARQEGAGSSAGPAQNGEPAVPSSIAPLDRLRPWLKHGRYTGCEVKLRDGSVTCGCGLNDAIAELSVGVSATRAPTEAAIVDVIRRIGVKAGVDKTIYGAMCHEIRTILRGEQQ